MAILRAKDAAKMTKKDRESKLVELQTELNKAQVKANKTHPKIKEIKKAIARILTINASEKNQTLENK